MKAMKTMKNRNWLTFLVMMAFMASLSVTAIAQDGDFGGRGRGRGVSDGEGRRAGRMSERGEGRSERGRGGSERREQARRMFGMRLQDALRELDLTDEQISKVRDILRKAASKASERRESRREEHREDSAEVRALRKKMAQARRTWDKEAFEAAQAELEELMSDRKLPFDELRDELAEVLTKEQMAKLTKAMSPAGAFTRMLKAVRKLELSGEQSTKINALAKETRQAAKKAESKGAKMRAFHEGARQVMGVLTQEQKEQLHRAAMNRSRQRNMMTEMLKSLNLSDQQQEQIAEIVREETAGSRGDGQRPDPEKMRQTRRKISQRIMQEVLTSEQAEQFRDKLAELGRRRAGRGEGRGQEEGRRGRRGRGRQSDGDDDDYGDGD